jgi:carbamoyl-phosphate synthase large subunit
LKNKRVFVSGGAGVIGRELVRKLVDRGAIVMVGDLQPIPNDFPEQVLYRRGDLNYITQQELDSFNPEIFFHLAATFERSVETYQHWEENFWHNIRLSNYLMTLMRNVPALKRVVYASSYLIYNKELYNFDTPQDKPVKLKEEDPINPRNLTGLAKLAHEMELEFLAHFKSDQFTSICARIYRGYGKNSRDVISRWVRDLLSNKKITVYNPEGWFDYMYAGDTAEGLIRLSEIRDAGIVNLGTGRSRKVEDVVRILQEQFPAIKVEYGEAEALYEASEADTTKLKALINWLPERDLEDTIPEIIEFESSNKLEEQAYKNVLVTSISGKVPLLKAVGTALAKVNPHIKLYGADLSENCLGRYFVDMFWTMPRTSALSADALISYCHENNIGLIIPTRDGELEYFSSLKKDLASAGIRVMVSDKESVVNCLDKLSFSKLRSMYAIPASTDIQEIEANSYVVKERYGAGSLSIGINLNKEAAVEHAQRLQSPIYQPYVSGVEVSVDAYITTAGELKGLIMRRRDVVVNGESKVTSTFNNDVLERTFSEILKSLNLYGHVILQAFIDEEEGVHVIECNPRFGGASTLSLRAGLDSFYWAYLESQGIDDLANYPFFKSDKEITQIRHSQDYYL